MEKRYGRIAGWGAYAPERVVTNFDLENLVDTTDEWIVRRTGIQERHIAAVDETTSTMAVQASWPALERANLTPSDLDLIIVATSTPDHHTPPVSSQIQHALGAEDVPAFVVVTGCTGFVYALATAYQFIETGAYTNILVIGVELLSRFVDWSDRSTCVLFGDAAGAAVVGKGQGAVQILGFTAGTDGTQAKILGLEMGGTRAPVTLAGAQRRDHKKVIMKGREVFREAVTRMGAAAKEVLSQAGVGVDDIKLVIPHQANLRIINAVQKALAVPDDKMYVNVQDYGNTGSASVPLALWEARNQGRIDPGDLVLLTAFGAGFHWAAALLRF